LHFKFQQLAVKQQFKCTACFDSLFATARQIAADPAKYFGSFNGSKAARYLLLNFGHPNVIFTQVVGKRDGRSCPASPATTTPL
jgi:hypothetical protein